ncbi:MAG: hypothetical protein H0T71_03535 [Acidobacteria bacterium]|nr:hypothetical protein [Acidobacteriota bacterium]
MRSLLVAAFIVARLMVAALEGGSAQVRVVRSGDDRLRGITQVDVVVAADGDVKRCAVERGRVQRAAVETLRGSRLDATVSEKARSWFQSVLISTHTAAVNGSCVTALRTELVAQVHGIPEAEQQLPPDAWGSLLVGPLSLICETAMVTSPVTEHMRLVDTAVRARLTAIGDRISAASR